METGLFTMVNVGRIALYKKLQIKQYYLSRRIHMLDYAELKGMLDDAEKRGIMQGVKLMEQRILLACETGNPINI